MDPHGLLAALENARLERGGGVVPIRWADIAEELGIHAAAFSRLKGGTLPGPKTLRSILEWLELEPHEFAVAGDISLPIGPRDDEWDGEAATNRVFEWAGGDEQLDVKKLRNAFFFIDPNFSNKTRQAYKLPFCDLLGATLTVMPRGLAASAGGHGVDSMTGATDAEKDAIKKKICAVYERVVEKYNDWPDCPFDGSGTRPDRRERRNDKNLNDEGDTMDELKDYSPEERARMAESGEAMPDGSYPIADCDDAENAIQAIGRAKDPAKTKAHIKKRLNALECDIELPEGWDAEPEEEVEKETDAKTAGIIGRGSLSKSDDPRTQALVSRVAELLREGAVAASIRHDLHPDASAEIAGLLELGNLEAAEEAMTTAACRPRHVAIVDTAAFSAARLTLGEDGFSLEGPVAFEGIYSGDMRTLRYGSLIWDEELLPIPIIWDPDNNDHDGVIVGYIEELERVDGMTTAVRPVPVTEKDIDAVVAAAGGSSLPAEYFHHFRATQRTPLTVSAPNANGLRRVHGHAAPFGVCHRSDMGACFQMPRDVDKTHAGFHTGMPVILSDGVVVRLGALTLGGKHIDPMLARQGVPVADVSRHRDDANTVFALVRAWQDDFGLAFSGVVMPNADLDTMLRAAACGPSVELWPSGSGRTLVGIHLVPTPAWPVAASAGEVQILTETDKLQVFGQDGACCASCGEHAAEEPFDIRASLKRLEMAVGLLAADALANIPFPEDS